MIDRIYKFQNLNDFVAGPDLEENIKREMSRIQFNEKDPTGVKRKQRGRTGAEELSPDGTVEYKSIGLAELLSQEKTIKMRGQIRNDIEGDFRTMVEKFVSLSQWDMAESLKEEKADGKGCVSGPETTLSSSPARQINLRKAEQTKQYQQNLIKLYIKKYGQLARQTLLGYKRDAVNCFFIEYLCNQNDRYLGKYHELT